MNSISDFRFISLKIKIENRKGKLIDCQIMSYENVFLIRKNKYFSFMFESDPLFTN